MRRSEGPQEELKVPQGETLTFPLTRQQRLCNRVDFHSVMTAAEYRLGADVFLLLARRNTFGYGRLGLIVAKKNVKTAVARNWVKRQCREYFRCHQQMVAAWDIVILTKKGIDRLSHAELAQKLDRVWKKLTA